MRLRIAWILTVLLAAGLHVGWCIGQDEVLARHHLWGRFQPGAWKLVRVVTETLDAEGRPTSTSTTETKTTLVKVENDGVTLEVDVGVEIAGKQFAGQPQCIKQGFHGELIGQEVKAKPSEASEVTIGDQKFACRAEQLEFSGPSGKTAVIVYYSDSVSPFVLKRDSKTTDASGENVLSETTLEVVALDMPYKVMTEFKTSACVKTVQKNAQGTITTLANTCRDVPGGVVHQSSKETDKDGHLVRRSVLELVSYGFQAEEERPGIFGRKRARRKATIYSTQPRG